MIPIASGTGRDGDRTLQEVIIKFKACALIICWQKLTASLFFYASSCIGLIAMNIEEC